MKRILNFIKLLFCKGDDRYVFCKVEGSFFLESNHKTYENDILILCDSIAIGYKRDLQRKDFIIGECKNLWKVYRINKIAFEQNPPDKFTAKIQLMGFCPKESCLQGNRIRLFKDFKYAEEYCRHLEEERFEEC